MVERLPYTQLAGGSNPSGRTKEKNFCKIWYLRYGIGRYANFFTKFYGIENILSVYAERRLRVLAIPIKLDCHACDTCQIPPRG